jgi:hypothetical protein
MEEVIEMLIERVLDELKRERRFGFYVSQIRSAVQSYRRIQHSPEWLDGGPVDHAKRIASPILDIIPPLGARMAMLSQDGLPELAASLGMVWDELVEPLTVWVRANLAQHPGHIEVGAIKGIRIIIRAEDVAKAKGTPEQDPLPDGTIAIEADEVLLGADDATKEVALGPDVEDELDDISNTLDAIEQWISAVSAAVGVVYPVPGPSVPGSYIPGDVSATKVKAK